MFKKSLIFIAAVFFLAQESKADKFLKKGVLDLATVEAVQVTAWNDLPIGVKACPGHHLCAEGDLGVFYSFWGDEVHVKLYDWVIYKNGTYYRADEKTFREEYEIVR